MAVKQMSEHILNWLSKLICLNMPLQMSMAKEKEQMQRSNQQGTYGLCQSANTIKGIQLSELKSWFEGLRCCLLAVLAYIWQ